MFAQIQRLQRNILDKDKLIQQLTNQINECHQKHRAFQENKNEKEFTIPQLTAQKKLTDKQNTIELLQNKLAALTWQNLIMKENYTQRGETITQLQSKVLQLERILAIRQTELQLMKIDSISQKGEQGNQDFDKQFQNYQKIIQNLHEQFEVAINEKLQLVDENARLKANLQEMRQNYQILNDRNLSHIQRVEEYISEINKRTVILYQQSQSQSFKDQASQYILNQQFGKDKYVSFLQVQNKKWLDMLTEKDNQIYLLFLEKIKKKQSDQQNVSLDEANMMHTIQQLKKCINQRSVTMVQALKKCNEANKIMGELEKALKNTQQLAHKNKQLVKQMSNLKNQCSKLKQERQEYKDKIAGLQRNIEIHNKNLQDILLENQCYHLLVFKQLGQSKYQFFIQDQKKMLIKKYQERQKQRKWVNISELIQTNNRLIQQLTRQD